MNHDYNGRRVLVTGGLGFIGVNLLRALCERGARPVALSSQRAYEMRRGSGHLERLAGVEHVIGDLCDADVVTRALDGCEVVFNLAGRSDAARSIAEPFADLDANQRAHLVLLEACRRASRPLTVVFASSRLVYAPHAPLPVPESFTLRPAQTYAIHKLAAEHYHLLYAAMHGLCVAVLRLSNTYGPLQLHHHRDHGVVDLFLKRAARGRDIVVYGDGSQLRDLVHVSDAVAAFLAAGRARMPGAEAVFNVGSGEGVPLRTIARRIGALARVEIRHVEWPAAAAAAESGDFVADIGRIRSALGWRPLVDLRQGLIETLAWYQQEAERAGQHGS